MNLYATFLQKLWSYNKLQTMKIILIVTLLLPFTIISFAQPCRQNAFNELKNGELDKAKEEVDGCINHPKAIKDARTWWYRGQIYHAIYTTDNPKYKALDPNAAETAFSSYKKALLFNIKDESYHGLDIENKYEDQIKFIKLLSDVVNLEKNLVETEILTDIITIRFPSLANIFVNSGVDQYKKADYQRALNSFESSLFVSSLSGKIDTPIVYYAALSAEKAKEYKKAKENLNLLIKLEYGKNDTEKAFMYDLLSGIYLAESDTTNCLKTLNKGIEKYPNEPSLLVKWINIKITMGKVLEAEDMIKKAIEKDSKNDLLQYNLGTIYEGKKDNQNAIDCYKKAIEINENNVSANYNLGAIYFNIAKEKYDTLNSITIDSVYERFIKEAEEAIKNAKPYLEKAHELDSKDIFTIQPLKFIYYKLGEMEKYEEMDKKLKELTK